jgi:hypothetical protein
LLSPPGGSLIAELTPDLRAFIETENAALARGDLGDAVEATLAWWVDGPDREAGDVDPTVRELVRLMQRRAFEVTAGWDDIEEQELEPAALDRLAEIRVHPWNVPTTSSPYSAIGWPFRATAPLNRPNAKARM